MKGQTPLERLKNKIFANKSKTNETFVTPIMEVARAFGCIGDILGRDFEVKDSKGDLVYKMHQKPIALRQLNILLREFQLLRKKDFEEEKAKFGKTKGKKMGRR